MVYALAPRAWNSIASCRFVVLRRLEESAGELYYRRRRNPGMNRVGPTGRPHWGHTVAANIVLSPPSQEEEPRPVAGSRPAEIGSYRIGVTRASTTFPGDEADFATSIACRSRRVWLSWLNSLLPGIHIWDKKYSFPLYLWKTRRPLD
jgi:hypothetical protein